MKVVLVQHQHFINGTGGAEKMCSFLANGFVEMGHDVEIATNENISGKAIFPLLEQVRVTNIFDPSVFQVQLKPLVNYKGRNPIAWLKGKVAKKSARAFNKKIQKKYDNNIFEFNLKHRSSTWKSYFESTKPDLVITTSLSSALEITFGNDYPFPIVNSVNGRPDYDYTSILGERNPIEENLLKNTFRSLAGVQILFEGYKDFLPNTFSGTTFVISNPVPQFSKDITVDHNISKERYKIINMARLDDGCKQQSVAIEVFSKIAEAHANWDLEFWGIGADEQLLERQIKELGLQGRIFLKGFTDEPIGKLQKADIFMFPSKYEGFGLALAEAMALGLPVLGFKSCSGVNELIRHDGNGYLAQDKVELRKYLESLIKSAERRQYFGESGIAEMKNYDPVIILKHWKELIEAVTSERSLSSNH